MREKGKNIADALVVILKNTIIVLSHIIKGIFFTHLWYPRIDVKYNKTAVAVVDGRLYTGGMTDRFIGIISLYAWAKTKNIPFRIYYVSPFNLSDYLMPNKYDWLAKDGDYIKSAKTSIVVYAVGEPRVDRRLNHLNYRKQIHFYGNRDLLENPEYNNYKWGELFKELFKPTDSLQSRIDDIIRDIGSDYFSIVLRFQNLLGDFHEYDFQALTTPQEMEDYISTCLTEVINLQIRERRVCIVTSDSSTFLNRVKMIPNVHIIPGKLVHMGTTTDGTYDQYEKSFIDFYILSESSKIYNIVYKSMYPSGFPLYASKLNSIPFERIIL